MKHYIYKYTRRQLIEFLQEDSLTKLETSELLDIAIEQLKNDKYSSWNV